jgi:hypothetical protein
MEPKISGSEIVIGSIFDSVTGKALAQCSFFVRKALVTPKPAPNCWNFCSVDNGHCSRRGRKLLFESYGIDSLRVVSICPKIVDFSFLKVDVHV